MGHAHVVTKEHFTGLELDTAIRNNLRVVECGIQGIQGHGQEGRYRQITTLVVTRFDPLTHVTKANAVIITTIASALFEDGVRIMLHPKRQELGTAGKTQKVTVRDNSLSTAIFQNGLKP